jgi:hypothetical protein
VVTSVVAKSDCGQVLVDHADRQLAHPQLAQCGKDLDPHPVSVELARGGAHAIELREPLPGRGSRPGGCEFEEAGLKRHREMPEAWVLLAR